MNFFSISTCLGFSMIAFLSPFLGTLCLMVLWVLLLVMYLCCGNLSLTDLWEVAVLAVGLESSEPLHSLCSLPTCSSEATSVRPLGFQGSQSEIHFPISKVFPFTPKEWNASCINNKWEDRDGKIYVFDGEKREMKDRKIYRIWVKIKEIEKKNITFGISLQCKCRSFG